MSVVLYSTNGPDGNNESLQSTTVGGSKPLHRFIKGQPKIVGTVLLVCGVSFFTVSCAVMKDFSSPLWISVPPGFWLGTMFIASGILYILTEHNPTKKTVTISLALSIVSVLGACWSMLTILPNIGHNYHYREYGLSNDNTTEIEISWSSSYEDMGMTLEIVFVIYSLFGAIILIVMSVLAGAALRSSKSQAVVVMRNMPTEGAAETAAETPAE